MSRLLTRLWFPLALLTLVGCGSSEPQDPDPDPDPVGPPEELSGRWGGTATVAIDSTLVQGGTTYRWRGSRTHALTLTLADNNGTITGTLRTHQGGGYVMYVNGVPDDTTTYDNDYNGNVTGVYGAPFLDATVSTGPHRSLDMEAEEERLTGTLTFNGYGRTEEQEIVLEQQQ